MRTLPKAGDPISPYCRNSEWSIAMRSVDQAMSAEAFLEDTVHEERLDKLLWMLRMRRDAAARQVPEWEELRNLASEIKEHTLTNLSDYLIEFEAQATANGSRSIGPETLMSIIKSSMICLLNARFPSWSNQSRC
jgi:hypothetical protein